MKLSLYGKATYRLQRKSVKDYNKIMLNGRVHLHASGRRIFGCNSMRSYASLLVRLSQYYLSYNTRAACYYSIRRTYENTVPVWLVPQTISSKSIPLLVRLWTPAYTPTDRLTSWGVLYHPCTVPAYKLLFIRQ
jgi:hypothetical protein